MSAHDNHAHDQGHGAAGESHGSVKSYLIGFLLAAVLTIIPFWAVMHGDLPRFTTGVVIVVLTPFGQRRPGDEILREVRANLSDLPGVFAFPVMRQGFGSSADKPMQFVIGGGSYEELARWRDILVNAINEDNPGPMSCRISRRKTPIPV